MVFLSLLSHIFNKELRRKKVEASRVREILNILTAILITLIMILTVRPIHPTGQIGVQFPGWQKMLKPKNPEE
jgi:hypothetical protein